MRLPFPSEPTRHFGRRWLVLPGQSGFWNDHTGCDWTKPRFTAVRASEAGVVIDSYFTSLKGWQLVVRNIFTGRITRYHMLQEKSPKPKGSTVAEGEVIGRVGSSGTASTGPHLHFEVWVNGVPVDPYKYITALNSGAGGGSTPIENDMPITQDEIDKIALAVWNMPIRRGDTQTPVITEIAQTRTLAGQIPDLPVETWKVPVQYGTGPVASIQVLAQAEKYSKIAAEKPAGGSAAVDIDALATAIVAKLPKSNAATKQDVVDALKSITYTSKAV